MLARRISELIDNPKPDAEIRSRADVIGITGPPGAGKSTLVDRLIDILRVVDERPGVLAVDPTSPYSGGALLGDRIRMQGHAGDRGVFIRSLATRGRLGGLAAGIGGVLDLLAEEGFSPLLVETVGVGQSEVEVAAVAGTVVLVLHPGWGDEVQAAKAGLLEIADIFFVNKADQGNVAPIVAQLKEMLRQGSNEWEVPVIGGSALTGDGLDNLMAALARHRRLLEEAPPARRRAAPP